MYHSVLYEWLEHLNIKVSQPIFYTYQSDIIQSKDMPPEVFGAFAKNHILVDNFTTFNMKTYRKHGTAYTDLFKIQMKKLFLESRKVLALERMNLHLQNLYDSLGFKLCAGVLAPFMNALLEEALFVQYYEYEEYINFFLVKVEEMNKQDKDFEMEPGYPRFVFTSAQLLIMINRMYILPQGIYMSLGRLALLIHRFKWQHDEKTGFKNKKESKSQKKVKK